MTLTINSTTSSDAELQHATSDRWREPFVPPGTEPEPQQKEPETVPLDELSQKEYNAVRDEQERENRQNKGRPEWTGDGADKPPG